MSHDSSAGINRRRFLSAVVALAVLVVAVALAPTPALAKSFSIDKVSIEGKVDPSGDLTLVETRQLTFEGDFSRVVWSLDTQGSTGIDIVEVRDETGSAYKRTDAFDAIGDASRRVPGTFVVEETGGTTLVHVFHSSADEQRTFTLEYRARGAAKRWEDTGELYWKLLGDETEIPTKDFSATIAVEGVTSASEVKAWAHGPLTGVVSIEQNGSVSLTVDEVPARTFVELRMTFPAEVLSQAPVAGGPKLEEILREEKAGAEAANRERTGARVLVGLWTAVPSVLALVALGFGIWAFVRHGREHKPQFAGQYFREDPRPDLHPAVIGALWRFGKVEDVDIAATLMELADRGVVRMAPETVKKGGLAGAFGGTEQTFTLERLDKQPAHALDTELMRILFDEVAGGAGVVSLTEIETYAKAHPESFTESIKAWKASAQAEAEAAGFFEAESSSWQVGIFLAAVGLAALAVFGLVQTGSPLPLCLPVPVALALVVMGVYMRRRSRQGNELYRTYAAVRDFLKDFSRLEEAPPSSIILWNRFLVLAVIFGVAEQVIEQLRVRMPEVVSDPGFQTSYWWVYSGSYGHSPVSALSTSFVSAASVASSQMSSSSGGGGGFSTGGGGGGGGGGFGAD